MTNNNRSVSIESCGLASFALLNSLIKGLVDKETISEEQREEIIKRAEQETISAGRSTTTEANNDAAYLLNSLLPPLK